MTGHYFCTERIRRYRLLEQELIKIFTDATILQLMALLAGSLFFAAVGIRSERDEHPEAGLYLVLAFFFMVAHLFCLFSLPEGYLGLEVTGIWQWLVQFVAPTLIVLLLSFGIFSFVMTRVREGLFKMFFGLTLFCYLFMLGQGWPTDVQGILTIVYSGIWVRLEILTG